MVSDFSAALRSLVALFHQTAPGNLPEVRPTPRRFAGCFLNSLASETHFWGGSDAMFWGRGDSSSDHTGGVQVGRLALWIPNPLLPAMAEPLSQQENYLRPTIELVFLQCYKDLQAIRAA